MAHRAASVNDLQRRFFTSRIQALHRKQPLIGEKKAPHTSARPNSAPASTPRGLLCRLRYPGSTGAPCRPVAA